MTSSIKWGICIDGSNWICKTIPFDVESTIDRLAKNLFLALKRKLYSILSNGKKILIQLFYIVLILAFVVLTAKCIDVGVDCTLNWKNFDLEYIHTLNLHITFHHVETKGSFIRRIQEKYTTDQFPGLFPPNIFNPIQTLGRPTNYLTDILIERKKE